MADPKISDLQRVALFARCSRDELQLLARCTDEVDLPADRTLIVESKPNDSFFVLLEGQVDVTVGGQKRHTLSAGDVFGEISMMDRGPATATVRTTTPIRALVMSHSQFRDAIRGQDAIAVNMLAVMAERLRGDQLITT